MATMTAAPSAREARAPRRRHLGVVVLGVMASYVIARYEFSGRGAMYSLFAAGLMFPMTVAITPLYIMIKSLGLMNSLAGIILPQIAFALPVTIIILVPFLRAIPKEIEEAASISFGMARRNGTRMMIVTGRAKAICGRMMPARLFMSPRLLIMM